MAFYLEGHSSGCFYHSAFQQHCPESVISTLLLVLCGFIMVLMCVNAVVSVVFLQVLGVTDSAKVRRSVYLS